MKLNHFTAALAAGTALISGAVQALPPTDVPDIEIFASGATAQDKNVEQLFSELCVSGTLDVYKDNSKPASPGSAHSALFCTLDSSKVTGLSASNPKVLFHKRSAGGSAQGVNPVLDEQEIDAMLINNNGNCTKTAPETFYRCSISGAGDLVKKVSDVGVSDVNPEMFIGANTPDGSAAVNPSKVQERMEVRSGGALVFNTPVTKSLRDALQRAQIDAGTLTAGCEGQDTEACMPSLSKQMIASLFTGNIGKWSEIKVVSTGGASKSLFEYATGGEDEKVYICRRVNGSGTQAQFNAKFLNNPCTDGAVNPLSKPGSALTGPVVIENSGSGDVDSCLKDFNDGSNDSTQNSGAVKAWAIGVQSTERNADLARNYRFIKIDGEAPTLENAYSGRYFDFAEVTYQWRKTAFNGPAGDVLKIIEKIATDAGKPSIIAANNAKFKHAFGDGGYLAVSRSGFDVPADGKFDPNNPVTPYTHAPGTLSLDNCRTPVIDNKKANRL